MFSKRDKIEKQLEQALSRRKASLHPGSKDDWQEFREAHAEVLRYERELAAEKGEPYAVPCDFPVKWDTGAPLPFLLCSDYRAFLTFYVRESDPDLDGTSVNVVDPSSSDEVSLCLVAFDGCVSAKLGYPNDEVHGGHYLSKRGLDGYTAQIVENSPWTEEVANANRVHRENSPEMWADLRHYIFWFHDSTFECLARSYEYEVTSESMSSLLDRVKQKLLD